MLEKQPPLGLSPGFSRYSEVSTATAPTDPFPILFQLTWGGGVLQRPQRQTHTLTGVYVGGRDIAVARMTETGLWSSGVRLMSMMLIGDQPQNTVARG